VGDLGGDGRADEIFALAGARHRRVPSAQAPAPMIGLSPTRPGSLPNTPAVEVAAASRPSASRTTQPTVPVGRSGG
jgi:hypothetical protein